MVGFALGVGRIPPRCGWECWSITYNAPLGWLVLLLLWIEYPDGVVGFAIGVDGMPSLCGWKCWSTTYNAPSGWLEVLEHHTGCTLGVGGFVLGVVGFLGRIGRGEATFQACKKKLKIF